MKPITDVNAWKRMTEAEKRRIKSTATEYVRKKTLQVVTYVLKQTPQLTGTLVQNWTLVVGASNIRDYPTNYPIRNTTWPAGKSPYIQFTGGTDQMGNWIPDKSSYAAPRHAGDMRAIKDPLRLALDEIKRIKWNSKITLINSALYAQELTEPGKEMGYGENVVDFAFRKPNIQATQPGMLSNGVWNIKTMTIMKFKYLSR